MTLFLPQQILFTRMQELTNTCTFATQSSGGMVPDMRRKPTQFTTWPSYFGVAWKLLASSTSSQETLPLSLGKGSRNSLQTMLPLLVCAKFMPLHVTIRQVRCKTRQLQRL